jgi:type IV pilus assembly protein PilB
MSFINFLANENLITEDQIPLIKESIKKGDRTLDSILAGMGLDPLAVLKTKGKYYNVPYRSINDSTIPFDVLKHIPEESALHYKFVPIGIADGFLEVGIVNPENIEARDALNFIASKKDLPFKLFLVSDDDFQKVLEVYKGLSGQVDQALSELESEFSAEEKEIKKQMDESKGKGGSNKEETKIIEDAPVTKIVATILRYAVEGGASDVHIEPLTEKVRIRFRIDGTLHTSLILPIRVLNAVVARIKILSKLKLDEKRKPQDGRFQAKIEGRKIDFRVSTFPTSHGEKVVMRILDQYKGVKKLSELGLSDIYLNLVKEAIERPYGMILISGPTGSGKSTTLYSILQELDTEKKNVLSLEDPVEYSVDGVSQSQVRPDIDYTFAKGLRTTLRQDPDIIMVGEIRDSETAKLAIQASLTGHLVLSTIHTNTASGIVPRLIDMGVDPYLIPPTLILGVGQRLVKKICAGTGEPVPLEGSVKAMIDSQFADLPEQFRSTIPTSGEFLKIKPTAECPNGTKGREAVFEMFRMNKDIEKVILQAPVEADVYNAARKQGMITMKEHAIVKGLQKVIPFEEINTL